MSKIQLNYYNYNFIIYIFLFKYRTFLLFPIQVMNIFI